VIFDDLSASMTGQISLSMPVYKLDHPLTNFWRQGFFSHAKCDLKVFSDRAQVLRVGLHIFTEADNVFFYRVYNLLGEERK